MYCPVSGSGSCLLTFLSLFWAMVLLYCVFLVGLVEFCSVWSSLLELSSEVTLSIVNLDC